MLPLTATELALHGTEVRDEPAGDLFDLACAHLRGDGPPGLVLLGAFGSGKSTLCDRLTTHGETPLTTVPLRLVARHTSAEAGLLEVVGARRLAEARSGSRVLLLDGLDEVRTPVGGTFAALYDRLTSIVGPRWMLTSRPGWFRTELEVGAEQVDSLSRAGVRTFLIDPLPTRAITDALADMPGGAVLLDSVEGLRQLTTSPLLFQAVHAALPFIEAGRPIQPWGVFDAWIRKGLSTGPDHDSAVDALEALAWDAFSDTGRSLEVPRLTRERVDRYDVPQSLRRALLVTELDGGVRFGHRSVYEFLLASRIAPALTANQTHPPDGLSGQRITEAMRVFTVGRVEPPPLEFDHDHRRIRIPRGNFIAGGDHSPDERPLRIEHLAEPAWIARDPVTNADWGQFLTAAPDDRVDANYLRHWGVARRVPAGHEDAPVHFVWPEDADQYAAWAGGRLPSASEWEKAVRGTDGRRWPWGDYWQAGVAVTAETGVAHPLPIQAFGAQGTSGLLSAIGGVFEYTATPWRGLPNRGRTVMGGCYTHGAEVSRAGLRLSHKLSGHLKVGLRLAWDADE